MKRRELVKLLEDNGWYIKRNGGNHDIYTDGNRTEPIPRHPDINERLAKNIIKKLGLNSPNGLIVISLSITRVVF